MIFKQLFLTIITILIFNSAWAQCTGCTITMDGTEGNIDPPSGAVICIPSGVTWTGEFWNSESNIEICVEGTWAPASNFTWDSGNNNVINVYGTLEANGPGPFDIILEGTTLNTFLGSTVDITGSMKVSATGGSALVVGGAINVSENFETTSSVTVSDGASLTAGNITIEQKSGADFINNGNIITDNLTINEEIVSGDGAIVVNNNFTATGPNAALVGQTIDVSGVSDVTGSPQFCGNSSGNSFCDLSSTNDGNIDNGCQLSADQIMCAILPVKLIDFRSRKVNERSFKLYWEIASAINFSHFEIEGSNENKEFKIVETVNYKNRVNSFHSKPIDLDSRTMYYRLKMIDIDGSYEYSEVISVNGTGEKSISIFPNPTNSDMININVQNSERVMVNIYTLSGELLNTLHLSGNLSYHVELPEIGGNVMIFEMISGATVTTKKVFRM